MLPVVAWGALEGSEYWSEWVAWVSIIYEESSDVSIIACHFCVWTCCSVTDVVSGHDDVSFVSLFHSYSSGVNWEVSLPPKEVYSFALYVSTCSKDENDIRVWTALV